MAKPLRFLLRLFNRNWDSKTSLIDAYATFFLLSYVKILSVSCDVLYPISGHIFNTTKYVRLLYFDGTIEYFGKSHLPYSNYCVTDFHCHSNTSPSPLSICVVSKATVKMFLRNCYSRCICLFLLFLLQRWRGEGNA